MREMARESVRALRTARSTATGRGRQLQAIVRLDAPPEPRPYVEYILGPDVPDDALDMIEEDAVTAPRAFARVWDRDGHRWVSLTELMREQHDREE
jgi:hypothetical protein